MAMWKIIGIIVKNLASGGKWLVSDMIVDSFRVYIYWSGDDVDEMLKVGL